MLDMAFHDPFQPVIPAALAALMQQQRDYERLFKEVIGPAAEIQKQLDQLRPLQNVFGALDGLQIGGAVHQANELVLQQMAEVQKLVQPFATLNTDIGLLGSTFQKQNESIAAALGGMKWLEQLHAFADQFALHASLVGGAAARLYAIEPNILSGISDYGEESVVRLAAAEQALQIQNLVGAVAHAETPGESITLLGALLIALAGAIDHLNRNTAKAVHNLDWIQIFATLSAIFGLVQACLPTDIPKAEKQQFAEMRHEIDSVRATLNKIAEANDPSDAAEISALPRGELKRKAVVRSEPHRTAMKLSDLSKGNPVAIVRRQQRWALIMFRDPLTDQLSRGWVYGDAVARYD